MSDDAAELNIGQGQQQLGGEGIGESGGSQASSAFSMGFARECGRNAFGLVFELETPSSLDSSLNASPEAGASPDTLLHLSKVLDLSSPATASQPPQQQQVEEEKQTEQEQSEMDAPSPPLPPPQQKQAEQVLPVMEAPSSSPLPPPPPQQEQQVKPSSQEEELNAKNERLRVMLSNIEKLPEGQQAALGTAVEKQAARAEKKQAAKENKEKRQSGGRLSFSSPLRNALSFGRNR